MESKKNKKKIEKTLKESSVSINDEETLSQARKEVESACEMIEECMKVNNISNQACISACASMITSILSQYEDPKYFYQVMHMMDFVFTKKREEEGFDL